MTQRKTLSLGLGDRDPLDLIRAAIARKRCVRATYNRTVIRLAPYALYLKHDDPIVDGVVVDRDGAAPRELKLGTFRLSGLKDLAPTATAFQIEPFFDRADPKYGADARIAADN